MQFFNDQATPDFSVPITREHAAVPKRERQSEPAGSGRPGASQELAPVPVALVLTIDPAVRDLVLSRAPASWRVETCAKADEARQLAARLAHLRLLVIDESAANPGDCLWLLGQFSNHPADPALLYVAVEHDPKAEKDVRAWRVLYYTARPLDADRLSRVLASCFNRF
jgi:hypothetical protein